MKDKKTKLIISFLIFLLCLNSIIAFSIVSNKEAAFFTSEHVQSHLNTSFGGDPQILKVATSSGPNTIDPVDCWDDSSDDVLRQVVETLFVNDLSNIDLPRVNFLAESYWWQDLLTVQIALRQGIFFHDGTPFNAAAAKWNIDRLLHLTNCSGTNTEQVAHTQSLWMFPDGVTPIIAGVSTVGEWNITIHLNLPYAPILDLLCYTNAAMLSPSSTPATEFIDLMSGQVIGTGPFRYNYYIPDVEVRFSRWDNYWRNPAYFEEVVFMIFDDATTAHNAILSYQIDVLLMFATQNLMLYEVDPNITVKRFTDDTGKPSLVYQYLGFNNNKYNTTWRKAFSYALNYSYVIEELRLGNVVRATSPISPGFGEVYNSSVPAVAVPDSGNLTIARQTMVSMGFGSMSWTDAQWMAQAESSPFLTVSYQYNIGNTFRSDLGVAVEYWLKNIGVATLLEELTWEEFLNRLFMNYDELGLFALGWAPDYPEPFNMLSPLFNPISTSNSAQVNDLWMSNKLLEVLNLTDDSARRDAFKEIQWYIATQGFFHAALYHNKVDFVHLTEVQGVPYNALQHFYAYPVYRLTPGQFWLSTDAEMPDDDGNFNLFWTAADGADTYVVYQDSEYIVELHEGLTQLTGEITDLSLYLSGYPEGVYYFIVAATNEYGYSLSNCIEVVVEMVDDHDLEVYLDIPSGITVGNTYTITATVRNVGLNDEADVELLLYLDDNVVDSLTIPYLLVGETGSILYEWTPLEYKAYSFKAYAPAVAGETTIDDNTVIYDIQLTKTQIFDGLFIEYTFGQMDYYYLTNFTYTPYEGGLFYETWNIYDMGSFQWVVDPATRIMSQYSMFGDGAHTPVWIFTDVNLGDIIPVAVDGEGDHPFYVLDEFIYELPGFGPVGVWVMEDLMYPGAYAWYEKSTGLLLQGLFIYYDGIYNYTLNFMNTNAQFTYAGIPGPFMLSTDADTPDNDGIFTLFWTESDDAITYSVYQSSSYISEITPELILLSDGIIDLSLSLEGYIDGTYYFIVVAHNENGNTLSNCIQVNVELKLPPTIMFDSIPEEMTMTYTRASQVIGSITAFSTSQIIFVGLFGEMNSGFALSTTYVADEGAGIYLSETTLITTNQLEPGIHELILRIFNDDGMYYDKIFTIIVYRQAELNLRGEFDYLLKERVKISIVAQAFDIEDQNLLEATMIEGMVVHIKIMDFEGNVKIEDTMAYNADGFYYWDSVKTIRELWRTFPKGVYVVQAWIEFPPNCYYMGGIDVMEFHIDPPSEELDPWFILGMTSLAGLIGVNIILTVLLKRKYRTT